MNLDDLRKIAENAHDHIGDICTGKSRWTMTVPTREDDSDILFSKLADGVLALLDRVETAEQAIARVRELHQWNRVDQYDDTLGDWVEEYCTGCHEVWPCATIRALEGDE